MAIYLQIASKFRDAILGGEFDDGRPLPTTRELARDLAVNRNTIVAAYHKLEEWGVARAHVGRGTFATSAKEREVQSGSSSRHEGRGNVRQEEAKEDAASPSAAPWAGIFSDTLEGSSAANFAATYSVESAPGTISFAGSFPAPDLLPADALRRALGRALRQDPGKILSYGAAQGYLPLRRWIAEEMTRSDMPTTPDEVLITNGSQQAIDLIARAFTDPGDLVLLENPTYTGAISTFRSFGARLTGLPLDEEGIAEGVVSAAAARGRGKLLYVTPTFQNPTSAVLSPARRESLLAEARSARLLVVEDDWASGLHFEGAEPRTLRSLDREGRVIYLSTFAKKSLPGLRVGWIAAARPILERLIALKQINDCCTSPLVQAALTEFCRGGALAKHLPKVRAAYRLRRDRMLAAIERWFPEGTEATRPEGGLFLWVRLPGGIDARALASEAEREGVLVSRGEIFHLDGGGRNTLRLTFASARPEEIDRGMRRIGALARKQVAAGSRRRARTSREAVPLM